MAAPARTGSGHDYGSAYGQNDPMARETVPPWQIGVAMLVNGFSPDQLPAGIAIALAESGGRRHAVNPSSGAYGVWQIMPSHAHEAGFPKLWAHRGDAMANTAMAKLLYDRAGGWQPWETAHIDGDMSKPVAPLDARSPAGKHILTARRAAAQANAGPGEHVSGSIGDAIGASLSIFGNEVSGGLGGVWSAITGLLTWIADPHNWLRIVEVLAGGAALLIGAYLLARSGAAGTGIKNAAGDAANAAKLAAVA